MKFLAKSPYRILRAIQHTLDGIKALWTEAAFRQEIYLCIILIPVIYFIKIISILKLLLILLLLLLLAVEAMNSAVEAAINRISLERHPLSKMAKDMGSAAVGIVLLMNIVAWVYTLWQFITT